ncbi:aspartate-alanine antiporter [Propionivibrio limicola]|uniref:aspartate-alanine antiporter n=1 Tax=Propionivibrio limicola TaxID=167645 RepID=UPI001290E11F|nr:aspartate-alanine antiporter [Propionivibrio limicola]
MTNLVAIFRQYPELAIFLTLALGFFIGRLRFGNFSLGTVVGTLLAGVIIGQMEIIVSPTVKTVFFNLFLFATGYKVGPQFFRGLKKDALPQLLLTVIICVSSLITAVVAAKIMKYDAGTAAGMLAGAFTESTVIGTAGDAINRLPISEAEKLRLVNNIPVAYAVTYLVGTTFLVWFLSFLMPRLMRIDLRAESKKLGVEMSGKEELEPGILSSYREWDLRAFQVTQPGIAGQTAGQFEASLPGVRFFVERIRRGDELLDTEADTVLREGDILAVTARRNAILEVGAKIGPEVEDRGLLEFHLANLDVVLTNKALVGATLLELAERHGRGVALVKLVRAGQEIPFVAGTQVFRGDLLQITGERRNVERAAQAIGYADPVSEATDMVFVGVGIVLGGLVGLLSVTIGGVLITLTASGGALVMGLVFGWLRSIRPTFGRIPEAALWVFDTVGLCTFIGIVGLGAGPTFVAGVKQTGIGLVFVAIIVAVVPHIIGLLVGRYVLRMNPVILLGVCTGAGTLTAGLKALQDESQSKLPVLGYTVPYAVGNILLTAWGPVIVAFMT